jgi:[ribosomal protein S5]-alanine N-acetyltransferase
MISDIYSHQNPPETLETPHLLLRVPLLSDVDSIFQKYAQDEEVTKFLVWKPHVNINLTKEFVHRCIKCWQDKIAFPWVVVRKVDNELVGMIELRIDNYRTDLGYVIAREYWGNGYATEITKTVIKWAITQESIFRVWATCDIENLASARVLEKAGMQREGVLRRFMIHPNISDEPRDCYSYSFVK